MFDTHCHLNHSQFESDREEAIGRARDAGVTRLLVIGCDLASSREALELSKAHQHLIQASVGYHPESAAEWSEAQRDELVEFVRGNPGRIAAWGEVGLDYYWDSVPRDLQQSVFEQQIECARAVDLPLVIHCRNAYGDVMDTLSRADYPNAVLHCFTGSANEAIRAVEMGLYIGVGGIATFKKSSDLRAAISALPPERLLIETDSPYLAPQPWRGKRNEPAYVVAVAEMLAELLGSTREQIAHLTSSNAERLFGAMD